MRILEEDYKKGVVKLQIETLDDLWVIYNVLREGDIVYARTTREVKVGEGSHGSRLPMTLGVRVKRVEFQQFSSKIRIGGVVVEGPEEYGVKGKHHTLSVGVGDVIVILKEKWGDFEVELIHEFTRKKGSVLILSIDLDEACIGVLSEQGVKYIWEYSSNLPGKMYQVDHEALIKGFIDHVVKVLLDVLRNEDVKAIVVAGPGETKVHVKSELVSKVKQPVYIDSTSMGGCRGVSEVLRRDVIKEVIGELNLVRARHLLDEFKGLLIKDHEMVSYGLQEVHEAAMLGVIKSLLVVDELLRAPNDDERNLVFETLRLAHQRNAEIIIVPGKSDVGVELSGFGGIVAINRFKLHKA